MVADENRESIERALSQKKEDLGLLAEIKWTKISGNYFQKYNEFVDFYFEFIRSGKLKIRILFTHNYRRPKGLSKSQKDNTYFLLYYQLIKHAFGLKYCNEDSATDVNFSILLDDMPDTKEKIDTFKSYISGIPKTSDFNGCCVKIPYERIAEIDSKKHTIQQGLDIILGAMQFRLNDLHKVKISGTKRRGQRTIAKEKVYKNINARIREIHPHFNIGISTGKPNGRFDRWQQSYSHWCFIPKEYEVDSTASKK